MEQTLKVTNVLSDPTRFNIYQYIIKYQREVSVATIAKEFDIHPNVARLHLSKLEDINVVQSYSLKTGKGGRPSRVYRLTDEVIELNFPHRDYKLLASICIDAFSGLGEAGKEALYQTGKKYGTEMMERYRKIHAFTDLSNDQKMKILSDAGTILGMYPNVVFNEEQNTIALRVNNCPFKEVASVNSAMICNMHHAFLKGMLEALFDDVELEETENIFAGCENCAYVAKLSIV